MLDIIFDETFISERNTLYKNILVSYSLYIIQKNVSDFTKMNYFC